MIAIQNAQSIHAVLTFIMLRYLMDQQGNILSQLLSSSHLHSYVIKAPHATLPELSVARFKSDNHSFEHVHPKAFFTHPLKKKVSQLCQHCLSWCFELRVLRAHATLVYQHNLSGKSKASSTSEKVRDKGEVGQVFKFKSCEPQIQ